MYGAVHAAAIAAALLSHHGHVTVRPGDTLSQIAARADVCGTASAYPALAAASGIADPDLIFPGQQVTIACHGSTAAYTGRHRSAGATSYTGRHRHRRHHYSSSGTWRGASGSYEACVISRESGGDPRAVNSSSGAGGLYQFLPSTWRSLGYSGRPQDAPVSVQRQAFQRLYAQAGTSPWSPSDGC